MVIIGKNLYLSAKFDYTKIKLYNLNKRSD